jgi:hypothetical protein
MAEPIVRTFEIDTTKSEQNLKSLGNAFDSADNSGKSLKAQLRELQAQLAATDPQTDKYRELSKAAGELKDKVQDAAQAVGTQAGGAFEKVSGSLGLVTSRIANLDFEGAAEGAKLLAQNISDIKPGDIAKGIQGIGSAFASVGKALLTNPIFLIGAAIAGAIVYAEELLSLIDGVTDAEQEALNVQKERAATAKEQFDLIGQTEETLKRQGLTEKQITDLKLQQLNSAILEQQVVLQTTKEQAAAQIAAAERNAKYLQTFLDFVTFPQRKIAEFFEGFVNGAIDILNKLGLGIEKISITPIFDQVNDFIVKSIFDPEEERKNQEKIVADAEKNLTLLINQRDGILNAQDAKEKAGAKKLGEDRLSEEQKTNQAIYESRKKLYEDTLELNKKIREDYAKKPTTSSKSEISDFDAQLQAQRNEQEFGISLMQEGIDKEIALVDLKYARMRDAAQGNAEQIAIIAQMNADEVAQIEKNAQMQKLDFAKQTLDGIAAITSAFGKNNEKTAKAAFKVQKAISIAQATISTYESANSIFNSTAKNPITVAFPGAPFVAAGVAVAAGLANVATIAAQQFQGGGSTPGNNSTPPSFGGGTGGGTQPAQFNPLAAQFVTNRPDQYTPRAYVLAGDVASQQEIRENVEDLSRIG